MSAKPDFARHSLGILCYLIGVAFFALNDALGKHLVGDHSVAQLLFVRGIGAVAVLVPIMLATRIRFRMSGPWWLHAARILLQTADSYCFYFATWHLPLVDVMTFYMSAPIIVTAISGLFLRERVGPYRWSAVIVGFIGVVIALAPGSEPVSGDAMLGSVIALLGASSFAVSLTMTRRLRDNNPFSLVVSQFVVGGIVGAALCPLGWVAPNVTDFGLMLVLGIVAAGCFLLIARALALAPASLLAPFQYSAIFWAALFGWIWWQHEPTLRIVIGNAILIASGLFVFYRERRLAISVSDKVEQIP
ncbi:DMT family transporter [Dongia sedimenti]|uniref:DMT family transporter n=1 Tax=Dongia sedimenti TaxID=3064282 RepID=A0ABU0YW37_9PROT|nr:DMT family transporter [Rhodospirillaceae bacterium R-7]